ncbi:MAG: hypothetical protein MSD82_05040, partial [Prevotella sp.]|nr:hypothetical protein [Prevotella sp.]
EKYYNVSPFAYCHNNPVMLVDPDGRDDYYDKIGNFLGSNNHKTDYIFIADKYNSLGEWSGQHHYGIISKTSLADADLSAKARSKILTNTISMMEDVDVSELHNGAVSVLKLSVGHGNTINIDDTYNDPILSYQMGQNALTGKNVITANIGYANSLMFATRSNIQNLLGVHEYKNHYKKGLHHYAQKGGVDNNVEIYNSIMQHKTWLKTTPKYKESVENGKQFYLK